MRKLHCWPALLLLPGLIALLGSCSSILPDRTKEYQYSTEIPPLEVPPDLGASSIENAPSQQPADPYSYGGAAEYSDEPSVGRVPAVPQSKQLDREGEMPSHLIINEAYPIAWRTVGKALMRMDLEITDRDQNTGFYYVLYADPEIEEKSGFWSSLAFWSDDKPEENEYRIKLEDNEGRTEVYVLNEDGKPLSQGAGLTLLKQMQEQIKTVPSDSES